MGFAGNGETFVNPDHVIVGTIELDARNQEDADSGMELNKVDFTDVDGTVKFRSNNQSDCQVVINAGFRDKDEVEEVTSVIKSGDELKVEEMRVEKEDRFQCSPAEFYSRTKGLLFMILGSITFSSIGAVAKILTRIPTGQYMMSDGALTSLTLLPYAFFLGKSMTKLKRIDKVIARCLLGGVAYTMKLYCIKHMNYGDALALYFTAPLFAGIFGRVFLKEKYNIVNVVATVSGILGIVLITKPSFIVSNPALEPVKPFYAGVAVTGAILAGIMFVCQRCIGEAVDASVVSVYIGIAQFAGGGVYQAIFNKDQPITVPFCYKERGLLVLAGFMAAVGHIFANTGMSIEKSGPATLIRNMDTVLAFVIGLMFFGEVPDWMSVTGAVLIISGTVSVTLDKAFNRSNRCEF